MILRNINKILCFFMLGSLYNSCGLKSISKEEIKKSILEYLNEQYPEDSFEIIRLYHATSPGDNIPSYTSKISSQKYSRRDFYMTLNVKEGLISDVEDTYAFILLEEAYLDRMKDELPGNNEIFYDVSVGYFKNERPHLKNKSQAKEYLRDKHQIVWTDLIGIYIDEYENNNELVEIISPIAYNINDVYSGDHEVIFHFYPKEMQIKNLQFQSDVDMMDKAPAREQQFAFWIINWRSSQLDETNGNLESFIENRKEIKQWRRYHPSD